MPYKYGKRTREFLGAFWFPFQFGFPRFWGVFNNTSFPLTLIGYEMIIANSAQRARWLSTISYPTRARGITVNYNIASRAAQSNSVYVSVLKIPIVHADSVSKSIRQNVFFARAAIFREGKNIIFRNNNWYKQRLGLPVPNEDNFATFSLGLEFLNGAEKEKNNGKGDSASVPSRFASLNNHFWYCCLIFASDLMHNSTGCCKTIVSRFYQCTIELWST